MAETIIPTRAEIETVWCVTASGLSVALPVAFVEQQLARGLDRVVLDEICLRTSKPSRPSLTVTEAARLLISDFPWLSHADALSRISYACRTGQVVSTGRGRGRRIAADSLDAWRLRRRNEDLAKEDHQDSTSA